MEERKNRFVYDVPTKIYFGEGQIEQLAGIIGEYGSRVLLVYGGGSIKRSGIYDKVMELLRNEQIDVWELSGVEPNPRLATVCRGVEICREHGIEVVLPIGGGSTIDCAKGVAAGFYHQGSPWDLVEDSSLIQQALPIVAVLTLAATGSEMDGDAVISNPDTCDKMEMNSKLLYPRASILDPAYTYSVPSYQTACGTADIMSHVMEIYLAGKGGNEVQDRFMEGLLSTCVKYGPIACREPENYEARANLMWASSWAINGFISCGVNSCWPLHAMEHQLSAYYDVTHGHGLAVLIPVWMEYVLNDETVERFALYGTKVFGIPDTKDSYEIAGLAIQKTREVFLEMGLSLTMKDLGIATDEFYEDMAIKAADGLEDGVVPLTKEDVIRIYRKAETSS